MSEIAKPSPSEEGPERDRPMHWFPGFLLLVFFLVMLLYGSLVIGLLTAEPMLGALPSLVSSLLFWSLDRRSKKPKPTALTFLLVASLLSLLLTSICGMALA